MSKRFSQETHCSKTVHCVIFYLLVPKGRFCQYFQIISTDGCSLWSNGSGICLTKEKIWEVQWEVLPDSGNSEGLCPESVTNKPWILTHTETQLQLPERVSSVDLCALAAQRRSCWFCRHSLPSLISLYILFNMIMQQAVVLWFESQLHLIDARNGSFCKMTLN